MKKQALLEICAGSLTSALVAQTGGADRIELCENLSLGGTTPSFGSLSLARQLIKIPVHVLIRPRTGNFCYSEIEFSTMKMDIECCKALGFEGVVIGSLNHDNTINITQCKALLEAARPLSVTFHRAFDETTEPFAALKTLIQLGFERVLTSGTKNTAVEGIGVIAGMVRLSEGKIIIMPGGNIRPNNISDIISSTYVNEIHSSAIDPETNPWETDLLLVKDMIQLIRN